MHIPDGFIAPKVFLPAWAIAALAWWWSLRQAGRIFATTAIPRLSVLTAAAFVLSLVTVPLPGGSSVHLTFAGLLTVLFGGRLAFLALSLVFAMQAFLLGDGGVTSLPVNVLCVAGAGALTCEAVLRLLRRVREPVRLFAAGWFAVVVPSVLVGFVLGLQPVIAHAEDGTPLYFPFGWSVAVPAVVLPHLVLGIGEGLLTVFGVRFFRDKRKRRGAAASRRYR